MIKVGKGFYVGRVRSALIRIRNCENQHPKVLECMGNQGKGLAMLTRWIPCRQFDGKRRSTARFLLVLDPSAVRFDDRT